MNSDSILILAILSATVGLFFWGRWRHDVIAFGALLACVLTGLVSAGSAFTGFGHPAVVTVACVLVLSQGLQSPEQHSDSRSRRVSFRRLLASRPAHGGACGA